MGNVEFKLNNYAYCSSKCKDEDSENESIDQNIRLLRIKPHLSLIFRLSRSSVLKCLFCPLYAIQNMPDLGEKVK